MRLLSYNACVLPGLSADIDERLRGACAAILRLDPDLILLQEVFLRRHLDLLGSLLDAWPHRFWGRRSVLGFGGGLAAFSRLPILEASFEPFAEQGSWLRFSALARLSRKGSMALRVAEPRRELRVLLTHVVADYRRPGRHARAERSDPYARFQARQLLELAERVSAAGPGPLLVCGDFNLPPDSPLMRDFLLRTGLRDAMAGRRTPSMIGRPYYRLPFDPSPCKRLDYALTRPGAWPTSVKARYALRERRRLAGGRLATFSDHYALLVDLD